MSDSVITASNNSQSDTKRKSGSTSCSRYKTLIALDSLVKLFCSPSKSKHATMNQNSVLSLVDSPFTHETHSFLRDIIVFSMVSHDPKSVLDRFTVQQVSHCKEYEKTIGHELLILELIDTHMSGSKPYLMCLERTASKASDYALSRSFTDHPDSDTVFKSVMRAVRMKCTSESILPSVSSSSRPPPSLVDPSFDQHPIPLSTFKKFNEPVSLPSTSSAYQRIDDFESLTPSPSRNISLFNAATLKSTKAIYSSTSSVLKTYGADDRFIGARSLETWVRDDGGHVLRQIAPKSLSLFELAVLADTVHNYDPLYSTLKSQCYWFANLICNVITRSYVCKEVTNSSFSIKDDDICIPPNNYLLHLAGTWMGILVSDVEDTVTSIIALKFKEYLREKQEEVSFIIVLNSTC
jgi:hypothetical protein